MESFNNWIRDNNFINKTTIKDTSYAGHGLFSVSKLDKQEVVIHIPANSLLTVPAALQSSTDFTATIYSILADKYHIDIEEAKIIASDKENERFILCLFLIYHRYILPTSKWAPYMDILPVIDFFRHHHILFTCDNDDYIKGTCLETSARVKKNKLKQELDTLYEYQNRTKRTHEEWISQIDMDMFMWADCIFWSRVVGIEGNKGPISGDKVMIPLFDFANHSADQFNMRWEVVSDGVDLITTRSIEEDEELLISYGSKPNQELLFLHGFCIPNNPEPSRIVIPLMPFLDPQQDPFNVPKIKWLRKIHSATSLTFIPSRTSTAKDPLLSSGWTQDSIAIMYLVAMYQDDGLSFQDSSSLDLYVGSVKIESPFDESSLVCLYNQVKALDIFPIIELRVTMLLLDAVEYMYSNNIGYDNMEEIDEKDISLLGKQVRVYRLEEANTLGQILEDLTELRDKLMVNEVVVSYLNDQ
ncbi:hypothetical protein BDB01DRAFT_714525 [Pilobolus umbonatus]|nr:hypothetical protein BDB01DRAFT_714525 [Pilobolus umbonatus]